MTAWLPLAVIASLPCVTGSVVVPYSPRAWIPDNGDARWVRPTPVGLETNGYYIRRPNTAAERASWRSALERFREEAGRLAREPTVAVNYKGVRAWIRLRTSVGRALRLQPGEPVRIVVEARLLAGNPEICMAFDLLDARTDQQRSWSTVLATAELPSDGKWHTLTLQARTPDYDGSVWPNVIVGQDATRNPSPGQWEVRSIVLELPAQNGRQVAAAKALQALGVPGSIHALYDRKDMAWATSNFACYFLFLYDEEVFDRATGRYRVQELVARWVWEFGGMDSVVLWHAYPRIGVDDRNQFDFYRDLPGGIPGVRRLVKELQSHGIRVFLAYNPWDMGTRREPVSDAEALARMVRVLNADGIFLDTMVEAPAGLRSVVDRARKGVVFEPEGTPSIEQLGECSSSWAQWFPEYREPAVPVLKWIEPRHMQHYIRRWDRSHYEEIRSAFLCGNGMLLWENVFGSWNPWKREDAALWKRLVPILRRFAPVFSSAKWEPFVGNMHGGLTVHRWAMDGADLYLYWVPEGLEPTPEVLGIAEGVFSGEDLLSGKPITAPGQPLDTMRGLGALVLRQRADATIPPPNPMPSVPDATPVAKPAIPTASQPSAPSSHESPTRGMVYVPGGRVHMALTHERRECGCIPDPGSSPEQAAYWAWGNPFNEALEHDYWVSLAPFYMDECLVTNGEYERFLRATGYRPKEPRNFLRHWRGRRCPPELRDHPVVYVDLEDARAYARWAGKRLPTEAEWQIAAQGTDGRKWPWGNDFDPARCNSSGKGTTPIRAYPSGRSPFGCYDMAGNVWQWTESETSDGHTRSCIIRGGSWFDAPGSIWYVHGGPQPLDTHTRFLMLYSGLDRCGTIGFRCVRDAGGG